jgi:hypothetical protein
MMTLEIPALAKAPSVRSLFGAVVSHHRRFSFLSSSSSSSSNTPKPMMEVENETPTLSTVAAVERSPEEEQREILRNVVSYLESLMVEDSAEEKSCFVGSAVPGISLHDYVERLVKYANQWADEKPSRHCAGVRCVLIGLDYLSRAKVRLTPRSVHRYMMTAVLVAIKFTEDFAISNQFWGDVGGCKLEDVNRMEIAFVTALNWSLQTSSESFETYLARFATPAF